MTFIKWKTSWTSTAEDMDSSAIYGPGFNYRESDVHDAAGRDPRLSVFQRT